MAAGAHRDQRCLDAWSWAVVSHPTWVLGAQLRPSAKIESSLIVSHLSGPGCCCKNCCSYFRSHSLWSSQDGILDGLTGGCWSCLKRVTVTTLVGLESVLEARGQISRCQPRSGNENPFSAFPASSPRWYFLFSVKPKTFLALSRSQF